MNETLQKEPKAAKVSKKEKKKKEDEKTQEEKILKIVQSHIVREGIYEKLEDILQEKNQDLEELDYQTLMDFIEEHNKELFDIILDDISNMDKIEEITKQREGVISYEESPDLRSAVDINGLKKLNQKIEISVCIVNTRTKERQIHAYKQIEWRFVLTYNEPKINVEMGLFEDEDILAGYLELSLDLYPKIESRKQLTEREIQTQLTKEVEFKDIDTKEFYEFSKVWWNNFKKNYKGFENRIIKLYTQNELGMYIPSHSYVCCLRNINGIDSPEQAARFVSLIPYKFKEKELGVKKEIWMKFSNILNQRGGDYHDHATLLCSLLLGFNLDAYVVCGSNSKGQFQWVLVKQKEIKKDKQLIYYYNPMNGKKYLQSEMGDDEKQIFQKVGCVFNNKQFYANIQNYDYAVACDFQFQKKDKWHAFDEAQLAKIRPYNTNLVINQPTINQQRNRGSLWNKIR
ncbi:hypothetical protein PPERSA_02083 [Pseudocohnilembus persalinus]|uniref:Transglutaminase-like domain-containing protein n=1 Tax=Pseudocohnilembus persalinus TaxID=266149 RepID=A0A0V0Q7T2_PSEPJ|nr:hypothetical protein PPERSA_02083 [Pseudocohnilembus persalinus]|eukprot:KRW98306.1 hypothetical protein PPERSA_02083 [Pseudocohnilembus persalinus]